MENLMKSFKNKEIELLENAGIVLENKNYSNDELKRMEREITEFIMNHSTKNGEIGKLQNEYQSIFRVIETKQA